MNIVYILGNGFDINLGLKTQYQEFYDSLSGGNSHSIWSQKLQKDLKDIKRWADMELGLGACTIDFYSSEEYLAFFEGVSDLLAEYLKNQEATFEVKGKDIEKLKDDFVYPEQYLFPSEREEIERFKSQWYNQQWNLRVVTLNYTRTLEKLFNTNSFDFQISRHPGPYFVKLKSILHLHGYHDEGMIFGVDDHDQIVNEKFREILEVRESLVKPYCNSVSGFTVDRDCKTQIQNANLICVFGCSLGITDSTWWDLIGQQLKQDCRLILFMRGKEINKRRYQMRLEQVRNIQELFLSRTKLSAEERVAVKKNILVAINAEIFKI